MNPLAQQALARARTSMRQPVATKPATRATKAPICATPPTVYASTAPIYAPNPAPDAPTDQYQHRLGKRYALDIVESCGAQLNTAWGLKDLLGRLEQSIRNKPPSFAQGVNVIVDVLRAHLAEVPAEGPTL